MLSRGGGAAAIQKVVAKVTDLPSPLDGQAGERIIVRETEEVYALDPTTRMWAVIGVLKKVGGAKPEDIRTHIEAEGNPHKTTLGHVVAQGASVQLDEKTGELVLDDKSGKLKALLRLLKTGGAIRIGSDAGTSTGAVWINAGKKGSLAAALRVVDELGGDRALLDGDGNLKIVGSAEFKGGIDGPTTFSGVINARGGINGGDSLAISAKKLNLGKLTVTERGLGIGKEPTEALDVAGGLKISGQVASDLSPAEDNKFSLGEALRRWKSVSAVGLNLQSEVDGTALSVSVKTGQKAPIIVIGKDKLVLDAEGDLGLGTDSPYAQLDVRGSGIAIGSPVGKARVVLADSGDGNVQLCFNRLPDDSPEDGSLYSWSIIPGNGAVDAFDIRRRETKGDWRSLLRVTETGTTVAGDLTIAGSIKTKAPLSSNALHGAASNGLNKLVFSPSGDSISYSADGELQDGASHAFSGTWKAPLNALCALSVDITDRGSDASSSLLRMSINGSTMFDFRKDGALFGVSLGSSDAPWMTGYFAKSVSVGGLTISQGRIESGDSLSLATKAVGLGNSLHFMAKDSNYVTVAAGRLGIANGDGTKAALFQLGKDYGLEFPMGGATISGVSSMDLDNLTVGNISVDSDSDHVASFAAKGYRTMLVSKDKLTLTGGINIGGLAFDKLQETVEVTASRVETKFKIPAGVRVEAVVVTVVEALEDATFFQVGDAVTLDRFLSPTTKTGAGMVSKGLNHCDRGQSVQQTDAPVVITTGSAPSSGKLLVTVYYMAING